jgi:tetratricopeptide (TPR) repeat protein
VTLGQRVAVPRGGGPVPSLIERCRPGLWRGVRWVTAAEPGVRDFFVSYTGVNRPWAEWIAVELERAGYSTVLQAWDFRPGSDFVHKMQEATTSAKRTVAVLSPAYFGSDFSEAEWRSAFVKDPTGELGLLVPVRVQPCQPPGLLASRVYVDLVGVDEVAARKRLLAAVDPGQPRPTSAAFPGEAAGAFPEKGEKTRFPGLGPKIANLPPRNLNFSGRDDQLLELHDNLHKKLTAVVLPTAAVHGLGGVGKTQLVLEYAHRFASDYDVAWWISAEQPTSAAAALAGLASRLGIPKAANQDEMVAGLFDLLRGQTRWLLIYDNAESPARLSGLLPSGGQGHVLVTSRWSAWRAQASPLGLDVLARAESVEFLRHRTGARDDEGLAALAELVGDLPLALEEAAAYLEETRESLDDYLALIRGRSRELFGLDDPASGSDPDSDHRRVATVWSVSLDRVHAEAPAAEALLSLCAFLAAEVPRDLPTQHPQALPDDLAAAARDRLTYNRALAAIGRYSLATVSPAVVGVHRLVQAVIQARLGEAGERAWAEAAVSLVRAAFPNDSWEVASWPECERLLPHLLAVADHAERLGIAGEAVSWLLDRASTYLRERGQYQQAKPLAERGITTAEAALRPDNLQVAWRRDNLGRALYVLGDYSGAREQFERALAIGEAALGPDHPDVGTWRSNLGVMLQRLGDLPGAREQYERALAIGEAALGPDHPNVGIWRSTLGLVLRALGDLPGAREQLERALTITEAALGPDHPSVATRRNNLGGVLRALGDLPGAREQYERALAIGEAALGPDHPEVGIWRSNLGVMLQNLGDLPSAREQLERALTITEAALGPDHPDVATRRNNLGGVLHALGDLPGAREQYERALAISEAALGPDHPTVRLLRDNLDNVTIH